MNFDSTEHKAGDFDLQFIFKYGQKWALTKV